MAIDAGGSADQWEPWRLPRLDRLAVDGFNHLARYVVAREVLDQPRFSHAFTPPRADLSPRQLAEVLWTDLVRQEISYTRPLHGPGGTERIRHPGILLRGNASGTCVDIATLFAAALLRAGLPTWLVMLTGTDSAHVGLAVHNGATLADLGAKGYVPDYAQSSGARGTHAVAGTLREELIDDPHLELIDVTAAIIESEAQEFGDARKLLIAAIEDTQHYEQLHLLDLHVRHTVGGDAPYDFVPRSQGILSVELDGVSERWTNFPSRRKASRAILDGIGGTVAIRGGSGLGKSQLALAAAQAVDQGFGWFLSGESSLAFQSSLALAEARERGLNTATIVDDAATRRSDLVKAARTRLEETTDPWVVVIDNADDDAAVVHEILGILPKPKPGQARILTSTLDEEALRHALRGLTHTIVPLEPLTPGESRQLPGASSLDDELLALTDGNPLLIDAFARISSRSDGTKLEANADHGAEKSPESAARLLVSSMLAQGKVAAEQLARLALMPPDSIPPWVLREEDRKRLLDATLLSPRVAGNLGMHRIFGSAIRSELPEALPTAAESLLRDRAVIQHLYQRGTNVRLIAQELAGSTDGIALAGLGIVQEQHEATHSHATFERAIAALGDNPSTREERRALAEALHARARAENQNTAATTDQKRAAVTTARRAADLFASPDRENSPWDAAGYAKARAMEGVLLRGLATTAHELSDALSILRESHQRRLDLLGPDDPLVDRAQFNPAGAYIRLAQLDPANARRHLNQAHEIYDETQRFRQRFYPAPSATTAASTNGLALVDYYRALLVDLADGDQTSAEDRLARAAQFAADALATRQAAAAKPDAIAESARILSKIGLLRWTLSSKPLSKLLDETLSEIGPIGNSD